MTRERRVLLAKYAFALSVIPAVIYGFASGPDPRYTGAPGDSPQACAAAGCHDGTPINSAGGKVQVTFSGGTTYAPGVKQRVTVAVSDPVNTHYGFQMTARLASDLANGQAGDFTAGPGQIVLCDNGRLKGASGCPANFAVQFIEHSMPSTTAFSFDWTPPSANLGNIVFYVAGNAVNFNTTNDRGDHVYTANYTLTPAASPPKPAIRSTDGVQNAWDGSQFTIADGAWISIYGTNLANTSPGRIWRNDEIVDGKLPTSLDGVSVTVNNNPAYVYFIKAADSSGPSQINIQVPSDGVESQVPVKVINNGVESDVFMVQKKVIQPALLTWAAARTGPIASYVLGLHLDASFTVDPALLPGVNTSPLKPDETFLVFGTGFGPAGNPPVSAGIVVNPAQRMMNQATVTIGGQPAALADNGYLIFSGEYQFNITVPAGLPDGDHKLMITVNGVATQDNVYITVKR